MQVCASCEKRGALGVTPTATGIWQSWAKVQLVGSDLQLQALPTCTIVNGRALEEAGTVSEQRSLPFLDVPMCAPAPSSEG